jgi:hypothetical protein
MRKQKSYRSHAAEILSHLTLEPPSPYQYIRFDLIPLVVLFARRHHSTHIKEDKGVAMGMLEHLKKDHELKKMGYYRFGEGLDKKRIYITDSLLEAFGYKRQGGKYKTLFRQEITNYFNEEAAYTRLYLDKKLSKNNHLSPGGLSILYCYGASIVKYWWPKGIIECTSHFYKDTDMLPKYSYYHLSRYFLNGSNQDAFFREHASDEQKEAYMQYVKGYLKLMEQYGQLIFTDLNIYNLCAMLLAGIEYEIRRERNEPKLKVLPSTPSFQQRLF